MREQTSRGWSPRTERKSSPLVIRRAAFTRQLASIWPRPCNIKRRPARCVVLKVCSEIAPDDVLEIECDILCPSALENSITLNNVGKVKAKIIAELANGPTTPGADRILEDSGVIVIPDILANAGGVTVSYYEWVQDQYSFFWSEDRINRTLEETMGNAFHKVHEKARY